MSFISTGDPTGEAAAQGRAPVGDTEQGTPLQTWGSWQHSLPPRGTTHTWQGPMSTLASEIGANRAHVSQWLSVNL